MAKKQQNMNRDRGVWETEEYEEVFQAQVGGENYYLVSAGYLNNTTKNLEGRLLTLVEAITEDKEKREAVKSLVKSELWRHSPLMLKLKKVK